MKIGVAALNRAIETAQTGSVDFALLDPYNKAIDIFNNVAFVSILIAMILLGIFAYTNVGDKNDKTNQQQTCPKDQCCQ